MAKELYGKELYKQRVLELNASDERGIDVVRSKIKDFAKISVAGKGPGFKLVILDEADSMTKDAQAALRRTMETYSKVTRFCLICNYLSRIIEPLASRCAKFRFKPLETSLMVDRLEYISREEGMAIGKDVFEINQTLEALVEVSEGDLRQAITLLQTCKGYSSTMGPQHIFEMTGVFLFN
jgi:replication factor C subunit 2/4